MFFLKTHFLLIFIFQGVDILGLLNVDSHTTYQHSDSIHEMQEAICKVISSDVIKELKEAKFYSVLLDESTDISVQQNLLIFVRHVNALGEPVTKYLQIEKLKGATAEIIYTVLQNVLQQHGLGLSSCVAVATDGAANMTGSKSGVTTRMKKDHAHIVAIHCVAHRLALAAGKAADEVPYLIKYQEKVNAIYNYFDKSAKRTATLQGIYDILNKRGTKFQEIFHTRWLSFEGALSALVRNYKALIECLLAEENTKAKADGLLKDLGNVKFMYTTHFLADAVVLLANLSRCFQASDMDLASVNPMIRSTISSLEALTKPESLGKTFKEFLTMIPDQPSTLEVGHKPYTQGFLLDGEHRITDSEHQRKEAESACMKFVQNCIENLTTRFLSQTDLSVLDSFSVLFTPSDYPSEPGLIAAHGERELSLLIDHYKGSDLIEVDCAAQEFMQFKQLVTSHFQKTAKSFKALCKLIICKQATQFPGLATLARIALTIPVCTADVERGFSCQNLIKVRTRSCLLPSSLHRLMCIKLCGPPMKEFDFHHAFTVWSEKPRRILPHS